MNKGYLMVTQWQGKSMKDRQDLIKSIMAQGKKARTIANKYEKELNGGKLHMELWKEGHFDNIFSVCPIPYSQAREHRSFSGWEDSESYK